MRLSHIKLAGFKSFVEPTQLHLPGQIVGIVGPNGCGKSNVIDALRWVLGESKASALRGESMQDVIFNGSSLRKAVARASVELVFDNSLGKAAGQWSSYAEIAIKRVLLRNGDSSYLINNQKVRRRDITDIFLGTGLGARAYAIVEQGMISRIIEAKPEELRVFLEEAAGVSKYRDRRRETAQRLNDTRDNLLRVDDILQEMGQQLAHLTVQAETARQYRELESRRDTAQNLLWLVKKQQAELRRAGFSEAMSSTRTELEAQTAGLRASESQLETIRSNHYQLSDALHARQGELYSANAEISRLEQQIKQGELQQQRLQQQIDNASRQIEQQRQQQQQARDLVAHWLEQQAGAALKQFDAVQLADAAAIHLPQAEQAAHNAQENYHKVQLELLKLEQQGQLAATQQAHCQRNIQQITARQQRLVLEKNNLPQSDREGLQQAHEEVLELEMIQAEREKKLAQLQAQLPLADQARQQYRSALQEKERQSAKIEARLNALQQLQRQLDNNKSLQAWLQQHNLVDLPHLWQSIRIEAGWENALEAVLRERLNALALPDLAAVAAWQDAPPARLALFEAADNQLVAENCGTLTPLLNYLQWQDERVLPATSGWLAAIYAVADVAEGVLLRVQLPPGAHFVTPDGHLIGAHSVVFHAPDSQLHGVLTRQREIEQLDDELAVFNQEIEDARQCFTGAEQLYRNLEADVPPLRRAFNESQLAQHALQMQIQKLTQAHERSTERGIQIEAELNETAQLLALEHEQQFEITSELEQLGCALTQFQVQLMQVQQANNTADIALREQREAARLAQHNLQEANFYSRTCSDKVADLQRNIEQMTAALLVSEANKYQLCAELAAGCDEALTPSLQAALQLRQTAEQALSDARISLENAASQMQSQEQARLSCEHQLNALRERLNELTLKEQEARLYVEQADEQLQGVDQQALLPLLADGGLRPDSLQPDSLQRELNRSNKLIEALGAVNLAALDELKTATERKSYLEDQALDLQQAMATLEEAIKHIDGESRALLMDTFNQVNLQLAELFPVLFAGGEARLVLTGEEILESGVQVMAQPPGKKNSSIHLLSGGEKALTAIALIFSLFRLNPAPFCLLDEVDAPLDDTNTERLCGLIRKMAEHTQFVFISHNKIAMEMAQQLIGVTMQEKGVSKVVSVDIEAALRMRDTLVEA